MESESERQQDVFIPAGQRWKVCFPVAGDNGEVDSVWHESIIAWQICPGEPREDGEPLEARLYPITVAGTFGITRHLPSEVAILQPSGRYIIHGVGGFDNEQQLIEHWQDCPPKRF